MKRLTCSLLILSVSLLAVWPAIAQERQRVSPHETINATVDGSDVTIVYGRPYSKDPKSGAARKIWGELVPFGKIWRAGADEATLMTTKETYDIGGTTVPAGTYSLYMLPSESGAKLVINKQTGQWGTKYDEAQDLVRVDMKKEVTDKAVDQFTIKIEPTSGGGGTLKFCWENVQYSVALKKK